MIICTHLSWMSAVSYQRSFLYPSIKSKHKLSKIFTDYNFLPKLQNLSTTHKKYFTTTLFYSKSSHKSLTIQKTHLKSNKLCEPTAEVNSVLT
jgi:ribosomal protein S8